MSWEYLDLGQPPSRYTRLLHSRWLAGGIVVALLVGATVVVIRAQSQTTRGTPRETPQQAMSRSISFWIATSTADTVTILASGRVGDCLRVTPGSSPVDRVQLAMLRALPGYRPRSVATTIDQAGQLCLLQISVRDRGGTVVLLRASPPWDTTDPTRICGFGPTSVKSKQFDVGFVAAQAPSGWTVLVAWSGLASRVPRNLTAASLTRTETQNW